MMGRTEPSGEWCSPTRELASSQLIRLVDESRHAVEMIHDVPTRKCPAATLEMLERSRRDTQPVWPEGSSSTMIASETGPDPDDVRFASETEVRRVMELFTEVSVESLRLEGATLDPKGRRAAQWFMMLGIVMLQLAVLAAIGAALYASIG
jgi:hypothetical protein